MPRHGNCRRPCHCIVKHKNLTYGDGAATEWRTTEVLQESGGALLTLSNVPAFLKDIDPFGLTGMAENADARKVDPSGVDAPNESAVGRGRCTCPGRGNCQYQACKWG